MKCKICKTYKPSVKVSYEGHRADICRLCAKDVISRLMQWVECGCHPYAGMDSEIAEEKVFRLVLKTHPVSVIKKKQKSKR